MYQLNDKIKDLKAYDPVTEQHDIHLDANESFLRPSPELIGKFQARLESLEYNRYPDPRAAEPCAAFAEYYRVPAENVVAGNGSDELITVIFSSFLEKGEAFATLEPDFSMYAFNGHLQEARHVAIQKEKDFKIDIDKVIACCNRENVKLLIFSNPCNPTSVVQTKEEMGKLIEGVHALVVLDEAYMDFSNQSLLSGFDRYDNLIILKTASKAIGMASLRLGFAVAGEKLVDALLAVKSPYNVNSVTQSLGAAVLREKELLQASLKTVLASCQALLKGILAIGEKYPHKFSVIEGETNFVALLMPEPEHFFRYLKGKGIAVRFTSGIIRVTCGLPRENDAFLEALENYWKEGA